MIWSDNFERKVKSTIFYKNYKVTLYEGVQGYHYFKKRWKSRLDELNIEYAEKELNQLAGQDFIKAKGKSILLITLKLSITLDTLTARILKLSSDSQSRIEPVPLYSWWNTTDRRADSAVAPVGVNPKFCVNAK